MIYYNIFMKKCSLYFIIFIIIVIIALSGWFSINGDFEKEEASESEFNIIDTAGSLSEALQKAKTVINRFLLFLNQIHVLIAIS